MKLMSVRPLKIVSPDFRCGFSITHESGTWLHCLNPAKYCVAWEGDTQYLCTLHKHYQIERLCSKFS